MADSARDSDIRIKTYAIDAFSGISAACCLAPFISVVDQAVTEKAGKPHINMFKSAGAHFKSMFTTPRVFFSSPIFFIVCGVYGSTYLAANLIESFCKFNKKNPEYYKLVGTTAVNMGLGVLKDRWIAINFNGQPPGKFPGVSWALFLVRDVATVGAGFTLPPRVTKWVEENDYLPASYASKVVQVAVPITAQLVLTPVHLLALNFYNKKVATPAERMTAIRNFYVEATFIRWGRVLSAYGVAGIINTGLRTSLKGRFLPASALPSK